MSSGTGTYLVSASYPENPVVQPLPTPAPRPAAKPLSPLPVTRVQQPVRRQESILAVLVFFLIAAPLILLWEAFKPLFIPLLLTLIAIAGVIVVTISGVAIGMAVMT